MATITTEDIRALADDLRFRADAAPGGSERGRTLATLAFALADLATRAEQRANGDCAEADNSHYPHKKGQTMNTSVPVAIVGNADAPNGRPLYRAGDTGILLLDLGGEECKVMIDGRGETWVARANLAAGPLAAEDREKLLAVIADAAQRNEDLWGAFCLTHDDAGKAACDAERAALNQLAAKVRVFR